MECKMPKKKSKKPYEFLPLVPDRFYRKNEVVANRYLGYGFTQLEEKIKAGEIDPPISLSNSGRACGWFGRYIIKLQAAREAAAKRKVEAA
jgi:hypothetical protein